MDIRITNNSGDVNDQVETLSFTATSDEDKDLLARFGKLLLDEQGFPSKRLSEVIDWSA